MEPRYWRMSRRDGKATLVGSTRKGVTEVLEIADTDVPKMKAVAKACPVSIIKV
jgi:ferredoxin